MCMWMRRIKCKGVRVSNQVACFSLLWSPSAHLCLSTSWVENTTLLFHIMAWHLIVIWIGAQNKTYVKEILDVLRSNFLKSKRREMKGSFGRDKSPLRTIFLNKNAYLFRIYWNVTQLQRPTQLKGRESQIETWRVGHLSKYTTTCIDRIHQLSLFEI